MKKVLILGAGLVVKPIVKYLLDEGYGVTIATRTKSKAGRMIKGYPNGRAIAWTVEQDKELDQMISDHDLTVSLLPYRYHVMVAEKCINRKKNMVTTSYIQPEMKTLDARAKEAGVLILNEVGLDPGIDHMSAMRIIDHIHNKNGKVVSFYSVTGALPAPEVLDNPFNYKFSWSPKGVVLASNNDAQYLKNGQVIKVPSADLFKNLLVSSFPKVGALEIYPNRDSLPYIELYGIPEVNTMFRGTFRHKGWCESLDAMKAMNLIQQETYDFTGKTYAGFVKMMIGADEQEDVRTAVKNYLRVSDDAVPVKALDYLGLFDEKPMNREADTPYEITSDLMIEKMMLQDEEKDMVVMEHTFLAAYQDGSKEVIKSRMLDFGTPATDTAVARTVALPAAMAVDMILQGQIQSTGVHIPVIPEIYQPILDHLENINIKMEEIFGLPESENLG
jgi:saccharopine dehydrogenase-like NADP-dependent oxidoreductase